MLNIVFETLDLAEHITVGKGFIYYVLDNASPAVIGPVDLQRGLWYAQIVYQHEEKPINEINIEQLLEDITGIQFSKKIIDAHFWDMQIQIAQQFSSHDRIFLAGDSAHAFAPTGGFGLNTGFGDVTNLAWKLAAVIKGNASSELLKTYEQERRPVCLNNLHAAEKNAFAMVSVRKKFPPEKDKQAFANANAKIAKQHAHAAGLTMGYAYFDSPLTILQTNQSTIDMPASEYTPTAKPGYFLPYVQFSDQQSIYEKLSPIRWTLIISGEDVNFFENNFMDILQLPEKTYPYRYILVRPDWHIAYAGEELNEATLKEYFETICNCSLGKSYRNP